MKSIKRFFSSGGRKQTNDNSLSVTPSIVEFDLFSESARRDSVSNGPQRLRKLRKENGQFKFPNAMKSANTLVANLEAQNSSNSLQRELPREYRPLKPENPFAQGGKNVLQKSRPREHSPSRRYGLIEPMCRSFAPATHTTPGCYSTEAATNTGLMSGLPFYRGEELRRTNKQNEFCIVPRTMDTMGNSKGGGPYEMPGSFPQQPISLPRTNDLVDAKASKEWWTPKAKEGEDDYVMHWSEEERWMALAVESQFVGIQDADSVQDEWWLNNDAESQTRKTETCQPPYETKVITGGTGGPSHTVPLSPSTNPFSPRNLTVSAEPAYWRESFPRTVDKGPLKMEPQVLLNLNISNKQDKPSLVHEKAKITRTCDICTEVFEFTPISSTIKATFPTLTSECSHNHSPPSHCRTCLNIWFETSLDSSVTLEFNCPHPSCKVKLSYHDISKFVRKDIFERYDERLKLKALGELDTWQNCLHRGCGSGQDHVSGEDGPIMTCQKCGGRTCVSCQCIMHYGLTCSQHQSGMTLADVRREEAEAIKREVRAKQEKERKTKKEEEEKKKLDRKRATETRKKAFKENEIWINRETKACPGSGCGKRIYKDGGCDHMTCLACRHQFCWLCLAPYELIRKQGNKMHKAGCAHYA